MSHLWVNWVDINRLRHSYGWREQIDEPLIDSLLTAGATRVDIFAGQPPAGMVQGGRVMVEPIALPAEPTTTSRVRE